VAASDQGVDNVPADASFDEAGSEKIAKRLKAGFDHKML
jgi:hypothetical protein